METLAWETAAAHGWSLSALAWSLSSEWLVSIGIFRFVSEPTAPVASGVPVAESESVTARCRLEGEIKRKTAAPYRQCLKESVWSSSIYTRITHAGDHCSRAGLT